MSYYHQNPNQYRSPFGDEVVKWLMILVLVAVYLLFCLPVLFTLLSQFAVVVVPALTLGGAGWAIIRMIMLLAGRHPVPLVTPDRAVASLARRQRKKPYLTTDPAWPSYFLGQVLLDQWGAIRWVARDLLPLIRFVGRHMSPRNAKKFLLLWPFFALFGAVGIGLGLVLGVALSVLANLLATGLALLLGAVAAGVLRLYERIWQIRLRASASCPRCYHVSRLPAYRCPGSHPDGKNLHRDLRSGRLGLIRRSCACGGRLPVTRGRASRQLTALCQLCGHPLHQGAAAVTDIRVPVFGATSAGKTQLLVSAMVGLTGRSGTGGIVVVAADPESDRTYQQNARIVAGTAALNKTTDVPPFATTLRISQGRREALLHLFDAAGEKLVNPLGNAEYSYLDFARTLVFVLDPFAIAEVRDQLGTFPEIARQANAAVHDPEDSYNGTVSRLRRYGVATERQRVAFVLTKADLLSRLPVGADVDPERDDPAAVRRWLVDRRMENLLLAAERDFAEVRYFCVNAKDPGARGALAPFDWLLRLERLALT